MSALPRALTLLAALALASGAPTPRALAPEVKTLSPHGEDAPDSLVKEHSNGKFKSCKEVAAAGLCRLPTAKENCAQSCAPIDAGGINASGTVTTADKATGLPKIGTPTWENGKECTNTHHVCASDLCYPCWTQELAHTRKPLRCADYMKKADWAGQHRAYCMEKTVESKCDETLHGHESKDYRGCQNKARSLKTCQKWSSKNGKWKDESKGLGDHNYCRNPDGEDTIWCFTNPSNGDWELCDPLCSGGSFYCGGSMRP